MSDQVTPPRAELVATNEGVQPIIPRSVEEAFRLANAVIRAGLAPDSYDNDPQKILIGILAGAEVGLPPLRALSSIAIINRRPVIWGDGAVALVQRTGLVEKVESFIRGKQDEFEDDTEAVFRIWRRGQERPYEGKFSVRDAKRAHLWASPKRPPWTQYPARMLMARARAFALRDGFADALSGLSIREEVEDLPPEPKELERDRLDQLLGPRDEDTPAGEAGFPAQGPPAEQPPEEP